MSTRTIEKSRSPLIISVVIFISVLALTQYLSYQQYLMAKEREREALGRELRNVADKFRNVLYNDITAANAISIIYQEYGIPERFDSLADRIMKKSPYVEAVTITEKGLITGIYPRTEENLRILNRDIFNDPVVKEEALNAIKRNGVYFAGPRKLLIGGEGIWADVPVIMNNRLVGFNGVLTRLPKIRKAIGLRDDDKDMFSFILKKKTKNNIVDFTLNKAEPKDGSETISMNIPEGDWSLHASYSRNYISEPFPYALCGIGIVLSVIAGLLAFRRLNEPIYLKNVIKIKTHEVKERVKELTTIYGLNKLLQKEDIEDKELFSELARMIPQGWQYPEVCACRIIFNNKNYVSKSFTDSVHNQIARFKTLDDREGIVEVIYTAERPSEAEGPFLKEERDLINSIAETLEIYFNKIYHQQALRQSEERFRNAFEYSAIGMALVSLKGELFSVNKGLCSMLGYDEDELLSFTFRQISHPDDLDGGMNFIEKANKGETNFYTAEKRYIHKNGSVIWANLNVSLVRNSNGNAIYFVAQIENITEKIESQLKFRDLVEKSPIGVYIIQNGKFAYVNPRMAEIYGYAQEEMINNISFLDIVWSEDRKTVEERIEARLSGKVKSTHYEMRGKKRIQSFSGPMFMAHPLYLTAPRLLLECCRI